MFLVLTNNKDVSCADQQALLSVYQADQASGRVKVQEKFLSRNKAVDFSCTE
jgi:hypothetical protein